MFESLEEYIRCIQNDSELLQMPRLSYISNFFVTKALLNKNFRLSPIQRSKKY